MLSTPARVLDAFDRARAAALRLALGVRPLAFVVRRRTRRIEARAAIAIAVALALTIVAPAWMLAIGPIAFGVPHVASEVRYLVVRRGLGRGWIAAVVVGGLAMASLRLLAQATGDALTFARLEVAAGGAWVLGGALLAAHRHGAYKRAAMLAPLLLAGAMLAVRYAMLARLLFVHLHNFGAVLLWIVVFRRRAGAPILALAMLVGALVLLASGATLAWTRDAGGLAALGVDLTDVARWLVPDLALGVALPLVLVHAFSDSVHYAMWLAVIPEEELRAQGSLTFRMSARALVADLGRLGVGAIVLATAALLAASLANLSATRGLYFSLSGFHGYLELAVVAFLLVAGRPGPAGTAAART